MTDAMLPNMSNEELLRYVNRQNAVIRELAERMENALVTMEELHKYADSSKRSLNDLVELFEEMTDQ